MARILRLGLISLVLLFAGTFFQGSLPCFTINDPALLYLMAEYKTLTGDPGSAMSFVSRAEGARLKRAQTATQKNAPEQCRAKQAGQPAEL